MPADMILADLLCSALAQACNRDVSVESSMLDLEMDSLTLVSVLARVEAVYGVELAPQDTVALLEVSSVGELVDRLASVVELR